MKKILFLFSFIYLQISFPINSQFYTEQNSGVTSSLNSVSMTAENQALQVWTCGDSSVVLKTTNLGINWFNARGTGIPSNINLVNISCNASDTVLTTGNIGTTSYVYRTVNGGVNWTQVFTQANGHINAIWMKDALSGFMEGNPVGNRWSLWKTTNGGSIWDSTGLYLPQSGSETGWNNSLAICNDSIWFGTNNTRVYRSFNYGANWVISSTSPELNSSAIWICDMFRNALAMGGSNLYNSGDGGLTWNQGTCQGSGNFCGFCGGIPGVLQNYTDPFWAIRGDNKVYWGFGINNLSVEYTAPSGTYKHMSTDKYQGRQPNSQSYTWIVRTNGGITRNSLFRGGAVRTVSTNIPADFKVKQNYPNPFNPSTTIRFDIPATGNDGVHPVQIVVYDVTGREVVTLVNEQLHPGEYETSFNAEHLSSGIYYYRVQAGDFTDVKKMVLLK